MQQLYRVLVVNPGSTSTKVAVFENEKKLFQKNVDHDGNQLKKYRDIQDQLPYRIATVEAALAEADIDLATIDLFSGRGGGLVSIEGGTYEVTDTLLSDAARGASGAPHPAQLGAQICASYARKFGKRAFVANSPDTDEYQDLARVTGFQDIYRRSHVHALNHKEIALRYCKQAGISYNQVNLIICHIGGGISVAAHRKGRMVDSNDLIGGEGPMMPSRSGSLPAVALTKLVLAQGLSSKEIGARINKTGGLLEHLGTDSAIEVERRIAQGDSHAELIYNAMLYQIAKQAGSCAAILKGDVHAIILTGGISHSTYVVETLTGYLQWTAPVVAMPGEFEMEALASAAIRVASGQEEAKVYTGQPAWAGFAF